MLRNLRLQMKIKIILQ